MISNLEHLLISDMKNTFQLSRQLVDLLLHQTSVSQDLWLASNSKLPVCPTRPNGIQKLATKKTCHQLLPVILHLLHCQEIAYIANTL